MNALRQLGCKKFIVLMVTLVLSLVSFMTLLPDKALPDDNSDSGSSDLTVFTNADTMAPATAVHGDRVVPASSILPQQAEQTRQQAEQAYQQPDRSRQEAEQRLQQETIARQALEARLAELETQLRRQEGEGSP